jgi:Flp pilus assembly protein TadD
VHLRAAGPLGVGLAIVVLAGAACASAPRTVRPAVPAQPAPTSPSTEGAPADGLETAMAKTRHISARARPAPKHVSGPTIEGMDPRLAAALLTLGALRTGAAHRLVAEQYMRLGIIDAAYDQFRRAVQLDPRDSAAHEGLARCWRNWGFPELAIGDARRAVYFAADSASAHNTLGTVLQSAGLRAKARESYARALALDANAAYALNNLCYVSLLDGRSTEAAGYCNRAIAIDGTLNAARRNLALVHASTGRLDLAWTELQLADPPARATYNLGIINLARREPVEALAAFTTACQANSIDACRRAVHLRLQLANAEEQQQ